MLADAETNAPDLAAESALSQLATAEVGRNERAAAEANARRALRANDADGPEPGPSSKDRADAEALRIVNAVVEPRSVSLQRAIAHVSGVKLEEIALSAVDTERETEDGHQAWLDARDRLEAAAKAVLAAPIANGRDALIRGEVFIDAMGRDPETGLPIDDHADTKALLASYKDALEALAAREHDTDDWDDAVSAYRQADREVSVLYREEKNYARAALVEEGLVEDLNVRLAAALSRRDETRLTVLSMTPPDIGGLLIKMEIVAKGLGCGDLKTYASRERILEASDVALTEAEAVQRAMALLMSNAAELRDRCLPHDWQAVVDSHHRLPGIRDSVRNAVEAGLHPDDITSIHTDRRALGEATPVLLIESGDGKVWHAGADRVWVGEAAK